MLTQAQKEAVNEQVTKLLKIASTKYEANLRFPTIRFDLRGTTAGTARGDEELNFNEVLMFENWENFVTDTIIHEVAHLVTFNLYGTEYKKTRRGLQRIAHGDNWKRIMRGLGGNPTRCHNMDVQSVAQPKQKFSYVCEGCGTEVTLTSIRHNRMVSGQKQYMHCRGHKLTYKADLGKVTYAEAAQMKTNAKPKTKEEKLTKPLEKKPTSTKKAQPKKAIAQPKKGTKREQAQNTYNSVMLANPGTTRQEMLVLLARTFGLQNTKENRGKMVNYFQNAKKYFEQQWGK